MSISRGTEEQGQVAAELIAVTPVLAFVLLALAQAAVAGYALWAAGDAARAGARAAHVGGDAERAALSALPLWLEHGAEVDPGAPVQVMVEAPALLPGLPSIPIEAAASLEPGEAATDG
jgi:hypothetical protein